MILTFYMFNINTKWLDYEAQYHKSIEHSHGLPYSKQDSNTMLTAYKIISSQAGTHMDAPIKPKLT